MRAVFKAIHHKMKKLIRKLEIVTKLQCQRKQVKRRKLAWGEWKWVVLSLSLNSILELMREKDSHAFIANPIVNA